MDKHLIWIWAWFIIGQGLNILKRAYFKVTGPDNSVSGYGEYLKAVAPALVFRNFAGAMIYWLTFYPATLGTVAGWFGYSHSIPNLPQIAPVACIAGISSDMVLDWVASKIPFLQGELPSFGAGVKTTKKIVTEEKVVTSSPLISVDPNTTGPNTAGNKQTTTTTKENV